MAKSEPNERFKNYEGLFHNLMKTREIPTLYPIGSIVVTNDQSMVMAVTKKDDREYYVKMYSLSTFDLVMEAKVGGGAADFIKVKQIEQNESGTHYAFVYINDGVFMLRHFGQESVTLKQEEEVGSSELNINDLLGIDNWTIPSEGFNDPFITCCFISDDLIFVNLFHNYQLMHYHFIYDIKKSEMVGEPTSFKIDCFKKNFPLTCLYQPHENQVYIFYRQGESLIVNAEDPSDFTFDRFTELDLG